MRFYCYKNVHNFRSCIFWFASVINDYKRFIAFWNSSGSVFGCYSIIRLLCFSSHRVQLTEFKYGIVLDINNEIETKKNNYQFPCYHGDRPGAVKEPSTALLLNCSCKNSAPLPTVNCNCNLWIAGCKIWGQFLLNL